MKKKVIGLGAGGHAKGMIEILRGYDSYEIVGLLTPNLDSHPEQILGVPILGGDELLSQLGNQGVEYFFVGVGGVGDNQPRKRLFELARSLQFSPVSIIHPRALISSHVVLGDGITLMGGAIVNPGTRLGLNVIVNTGAVIEHDCTIDSHVHIATGAQLAGAVNVGEGAHVGIGAIVRQGIQIGQRAVVGAGAVVVKDVLPDTVVAGVPAKPMKVLETTS